MQIPHRTLQLLKGQTAHITLGEDSYRELYLQVQQHQQMPQLTVNLLKQRLQQMIMRRIKANPGRHPNQDHLDLKRIDIVLFQGEN